MCRAKPAPPMRAGGVADVGDTPVDLLALQREGRGGHAPARLRQLAHAIRRGAHDGRRAVWKDARQWWHVARDIAHGPRKRADGLLTGCYGVEVAHGRPA
jgi:hypothetical protein